MTLRRIGRGGVAAAGWRRELRIALARRRRLLAAGLMAGSMAFAISALSPTAARTVTVLAAAHDLVGGATIAESDLRELSLPAAVVPAGAVDDAARLTGRVLAGPVRAGEAFTDVRLVGPSLLAGYGDRMVASPVRIADAASARLVRPGDVIDVLAAGPSDEGGDTEARLVAAGVRVVLVPGDDETALAGESFGEGALVVLATTSEAATRLASEAVTSRLSLTIRGS